MPVISKCRYASTSVDKTQGLKKIIKKNSLFFSFLSFFLSLLIFFLNYYYFMLFAGNYLHCLTSHILWNWDSAYRTMLKMAEFSFRRSRMIRNYVVFIYLFIYLLRERDCRLLFTVVFNNDDFTSQLQNTKQAYVRPCTISRLLRRS